MMQKTDDGLTADDKSNVLMQSIKNIAVKKKLADILEYGTGVPDEVLELVDNDDDA